MVLLLLTPIKSLAGQEREAWNAAAKAFYEYEHWNDDVNRFLQHYEGKLTPRQKKIGGYVYLVLDAINRQEIRFRWTFP